jgi:hypothetical protein
VDHGHVGAGGLGDAPGGSSGVSFVGEQVARGVQDGRRRGSRFGRPQAIGQIDAQLADRSRRVVIPLPARRIAPMNRAGGDRSPVENC